MGRWATNLMILGSLSVMAAVGWYFYSQYEGTRMRADTLSTIQDLSEEAGPCAALLEATALGTHLEYAHQNMVESLRKGFAAKIAGSGDSRAIQVLLGATREGLIDATLCEQLYLTALTGEMHPVMGLLLFTRQDEDPCQETYALDRVIRGLGSHRAMMLRGLMEEVGRLHCLAPMMAHAVASEVADMAYEDTQAFDDLDVLRIASFLHKWSPLRAAQVGCLVEVRGDISRLGNALGCGSDVLERVLTRYRYAHALPAKGDAPALPEGTEVFLLDVRDERCEIRTYSDTAELYKVNCADLTSLSDLHVAVLIEPVTYGIVHADLVAGLATFDGRRSSLERATEEPPRQSWFGYDREGRPLGATQTVDLADVAAQIGEEVPESPLRTFCRDSGAKYCYDVDWARVLGKLQGGAVVFLSRPSSVFASQLSPGDDALGHLFVAAFGRPPREDAIARAYTLSDDAHMVVETRRDGVEMRWRLSKSGAWQAQSFGAGEGGVAPPAARLIAVLDVQRDGRPEVILQRAVREQRDGELRDSMDEIYLMRLARADTKFEIFNRLTVHEY